MSSDAKNPIIFPQKLLFAFSLLKRDVSGCPVDISVVSLASVKTWTARMRTE